MRGKLAQTRFDEVLEWIIPAHAGQTEHANASH